jgi:hypothetical protein
MDDQNIPNQSSEQEPAEGSRDPVDRNVDDKAADERYGDSDEQQADEGGGITNRPLARERQEQRDLPPRGDARPGGHAS